MSLSRKSFLQISNVDVKNHYEILKKLGEGSYGKTYKVKNKNSSDIRAMKQMEKIKIPDMNVFKNEINIMSILDHPNIIKLYEVFEDDKFFYLIIEYCDGGELLHRIRERNEKGNPYKEKEIAEIFKEIISAIAYCHDNNVVHRDLKLENILFINKDENSEIKIIDFGISTILEKKDNKIKKLKSKIGTVYYMSPEILKGSYTELCDIWACGVILYIMVFGFPPFNGNNDKEIYESIKKGKLEFPCKISKNLKDLFNNMLCSEKTRFNAKQVLDHIWIKKKAPDSDNEGIKIDLNKLIKFQHYNKLKKAVLCLIASRINSNEVNNLKDIFNALDKDKNGTLSKDEIKQCLEQKNIKINFDKMFDSIDTNKNGNIDYTEFLAFMLDEKFYMNEDKLNEAFKVFDPEEKGLITVDNIKKLLNLDENDNEILNEFIKENDKDGNGKIDYREFIKMMVDN